MGILGIGGSLALITFVIWVLVWLFGGAIKISVNAGVLRRANATDEEIKEYALKAAKDDSALLKFMRALGDLLRVLRGDHSRELGSGSEPPEHEPPDGSDEPRSNSP